MLRCLPNKKQPLDLEKLRTLAPKEARDHIGDGNYAGLYQRPDEEMLAIWEVAVHETRALLTENW